MRLQTSSDQALSYVLLKSIPTRQRVVKNKAPATFPGRSCRLLQWWPSSRPTIYLHSLSFEAYSFVVKGRDRGRNGALGSCFGDFRCAFSACSHYWYACVAYIGLTSKQGTQRKSREKKDILKNQGKSGKL